jgi:hypothetical protein
MCSSPALFSFGNLSNKGVNIGTLKDVAALTLDVALQKGGVQSELVDNYELFALVLHVINSHEFVKRTVS